MGNDGTTELRTGVNGDVTVKPLDSGGIQPLDAHITTPTTQSPAEHPTLLPTPDGEVGNIPATKDRTPQMPQLTADQMNNWPMSAVNQQEDNVVRGDYKPILDPVTNKPYIQDANLPAPASTLNETPAAPTPIPAPTAETAQKNPVVMPPTRDAQTTGPGWLRTLRRYASRR